MTSVADQASRARAEAPSIAALAAFAAAFAWTLLVRLPLLRLDGLDDVFFIEVAHFWTRGVLPYVGAFDVKPPGFFALVAAAQSLFGPSLASLRAVAIPCDATTAVALFYLGRRFHAPAVGLFAALLYPILSETIVCNDAYCPLAALTTLAFLTALSPLSLMQRAALAGLLIGAAGTIKQTAIFEAVALFAVLIGAPGAKSRRFGAALAFGLAAAIAPLGFLAYFAAHGAAGPLIADVVVAAVGRPVSDSDGLSFAGGLIRLLPLQKPILPIFAFGCLALLRWRKLAPNAGDAPIGALVAWFAAAIVSIIVQRSLMITYLGPSLAPGLLLAGLCIVKAAPELSRLPPELRLGALALASLAAALLTPGDDLSARRQSRAIAGAAEAIRSSGLDGGDKIYVVNRSIWLYSALETAPPTRYYLPFHTLCAFADAGPPRLAKILATRPRYLIIADRRISGVCELKASWRLVDAALRTDYRLLARAQGEGDFYDIYETSDAASQ